jgi:heme/copper-type cytochrome/quinol oxidase subunit 1
MILPGFGVISEIVPAFARKRLFGYKFVVWASMAIAVISFFVWGHHMFVAGTSLYSALVFSILSFMVAVPSAIKVFNWIGTMHKGFIRFDAPMLYAIGFIGLFTTGGLTGLFVAALAADVHLTQTYFVVAHFHYVMVGGMVSAYFAGLHFWWPKIKGTDVSRDVGPHRRGDNLHWLQSDLLPAVHSGLSGHAPSLSLLPAGIRGVERALVRWRDDTGPGLPAPARLFDVVSVLRRASKC